MADTDGDAVAVTVFVDVGLAVLVHGSSEAVVVTDGELEWVEESVGVGVVDVSAD